MTSIDWSTQIFALNTAYARCTWWWCQQCQWDCEINTTDEIYTTYYTLFYFFGNFRPDSRFKPVRVSPWPLLMGTSWLRCVWALSQYTEWSTAPGWWLSSPEALYWHLTTEGNHHRRYHLQRADKGLLQVYRVEHSPHSLHTDNKDWRMYKQSYEGRKFY